MMQDVTKRAFRRLCAAVAVMLACAGAALADDACPSRRSADGGRAKRLALSARIAEARHKHESGAYYRSALRQEKSKRNRNPPAAK